MDNNDFYLSKFYFNEENFRNSNIFEKNGYFSKYDFIDFTIFLLNDKIKNSNNILDIFNKEFNFLNDFVIFYLIFPFIEIAEIKNLNKIFEKDINSNLIEIDKNLNKYSSNGNLFTNILNIFNKIEFLEDILKIYLNSKSTELIYNLYWLLSEFLFLNFKNETKYKEFKNLIIEKISFYQNELKIANQNIYEKFIEIYQKMNNNLSNLSNEFLFELFFPNDDENNILNKKFSNNNKITQNDYLNFFNMIDFDIFLNYFSNNKQLKCILNNEQLLNSLKIIYSNQKDKIKNNLTNLNYLKSKNAQFIAWLLDKLNDIEIFNCIFDNIIKIKDNLTNENDWEIKFLKSLPNQQGFSILIGLMLSYKDCNKIKMIQNILDSFQSQY